MVRKIVVPVVVDAADLVPDGQPRRRVEPGRRLVEEEDLRAVDEGAREVEAPLHPARVVLRAAVGRVGQPDQLEQLVVRSAPSAPVMP